MRNRPTLERIKELLLVDAKAGNLTWRKGRGRAAAGDAAGRINQRGYRELSVDGKFCSAHSIVFYVAYGWWPERIDHINGNRADNRIANLREADAATNSRNRTNWVTPAGLLGATPTKAGKWMAQIHADGVGYHLGMHDTEEQAHAAYVNARDKCAEAEMKARHTVLLALRSQSLVNRAPAMPAMRSQLTVLEEIQAGRVAA